MAQATWKTLLKVHNLLAEAHTEDMPASNLGAAKRAFVKVLLSLAVSYAVALEVNRDSADSVLVRTVKGLVAKKQARGRRAKIALSIFGLRLGLSDTTLHARDATALEKKRATANERDTHFCSRFGPSNLQNPKRERACLVLDCTGTDGERCCRKKRSQGTQSKNCTEHFWTSNGSQ